MKENATELVFILDRSGSMAGLESDTIGGFNSMLAKQKKVDGLCRITTVLFASDYQLLHDRINIEDVYPLTEKDYFVGGCTALLDAIGHTINKIVAVAKASDDNFAKNVMFVIITDGYENASREYNYQTIKKLIDTQKEKYGWEFIFLGANIDAQETAKNLGIAQSRAADYVADSQGSTLVYEQMSQCVENFRTLGQVNIGSLDCIRADHKKRGKKQK